ncbi:family 1 glycosylhydrolase [Galbitalea sp. SE-J8]|uniref:family 1 glycosylhydrolase n=1 Tax=Galbitalea sp. SE-J8 TaxID=3054952 RepID=UPI00259C92D8|nr:family 1 glycosylhydrolase [Galbitalea sp. SE-J8]MDM4761663.1 family 1 glycosylhydrolase [Galbitalea sp. SE-J8]
MPNQFADGRFRFGLGIEDTFIPQIDFGRRELDEYTLTQHYSKWRDDLDLVADSRAQTLRYGFPWYRMNPEPGKFDFRWSDPVVDKLAETGVDVIVDLMHYGVPLWLDNAFLNRDYSKRVAEWAHALSERYGDRLTAWTPLNEPQINAFQCGEIGLWPPYFHGDDGFLQVLRALCEGIVRSQDAIREATGDTATFVHVDAMFRYKEQDGIRQDSVALRRERRFLAEDLVTGRVDAAHPLAGHLAEHGITDSELDWFRTHTAHPDVLGVNYYPVWGTEEFVHDDEGRIVMRRRNDWIEGLEEFIREFTARFEVPVMVTETSRDGTPEQRIEWLDDSVALMRRLRDEGVDVVGYTWWPLFDVIEWQYREALTPVEKHVISMGLYNLTPDGVGGFERTHTSAVDRFREIAADGLPAKAIAP